MIFVIMNYGVHRNQQGRTWKSKAAAFVTASVLGGLLMGGLLGLAGSLVPHGARERVALALAAAAISIGLALTLGRRIPLPQRNRETGQLWMNSGALTGAVLNGLSLGAGFVTRVGYWLWYAVPIACVLSGSPVVGAVVFGTYALARGLGPLAGIAVTLFDRSETQSIPLVQHRLMARAPAARRLADAHVSLLGTLVLVWLV